MGTFTRLFVTGAGMALASSTVLFATPLAAQTSTGAPPARPAQGAAASSRPAPQEAQRLACTNLQAGEPLTMVMGKSRVVQLASPAVRLLGGGGRVSSLGSAPAAPAAAPGMPPMPGTPAAAMAPASATSLDGVAEVEVTLLSPTELLVIGRRPGTANVIVQDQSGRCAVRDITVTVDPDSLQAALRGLLPRESDVRIAGAGSSLVLTGSVSDAVTLDQVLTLASAYGEDKRIVNMLRVSAPQQVMLDVKIAEVSKSLLDRLGLNFSRVVSSGDRTSIISGILGGESGLLGRFGPNANGTFGGAFTAGASSGAAAAAASTIAPLPTRGASLLGIDVDNRDGIVRLLAEPNIMAISGQSASFLSGGKIFIPVSQTNQGGGVFITLEEKEFGVGLKFTPTVLDGRINLKVASEVSELSQSGTPFTTVGNITAVLPSMTTRRVDTTVQLADGQSFAVAGLIRHNYAAAIDKFPGLGETPVLGALFRSTEFQNDQTELLFVITPRLVKPTTAPIALPTDSLVVPSRADVMLRGKGEGSPALTTPTGMPAGNVAPTAPTAPPATPAPVAPPTPLTPRPTSSVPADDTFDITEVVPGSTANDPAPPAQSDQVQRPAESLARSAPVAPARRPARLMTADDVNNFMLAEQKARSSTDPIRHSAQSSPRTTEPLTQTPGYVTVVQPTIR